MKHRVLYFLAFFFLIVIIPSCELLEDCKTCKLITIINDVRTEGPGIIYCDEKLDEKENMGTVEIAGGISFYECN